MKNIIDSLNKVFSTFDNENLQKSLSWAEETRQRLIDFKKSEEAKTLRKDQYAYYNKMFVMCTSKTWFHVMENSNKENLEEFVKNNHNEKINKRNAKITEKLKTFQIEDVSDLNYTFSNDGFDGVYNVKTEKGNKVIKINSIIAGGYNVQIAHMRVLISIK